MYRAYLFGFTAFSSQKMSSFAVMYKMRYLIFEVVAFPRIMFLTELLILLPDALQDSPPSIFPV